MISNPTSVQVIEGQNEVTFTVGASGSGDLRYQWYYKTSLDGVEIAIPGANSPTYKIPREEVTIDLSGRYYYVKVTQSLGTATVTKKSAESLLTSVEKARILQEPASITVVEGRKATFEVAVTGAGTLSYQWYKSTTNSTTNGTAITGETEPTYTIQNATVEDNNTYYYCEVTQSYGSSEAIITSSIAKLIVGNGVSVSRPNDVSVIEGVTDVTFTVKASGSGDFTYQWYKNTTDSNTSGTPIDGAIGDSYTIEKENVTAELNNTYYYVIVTQNYEGQTTNITSEAAKLSVVVQAEIQTNPQAVLAYEKARNVIFSITAQGEGNITYQWYKNTTNSNEGGEKISGAVGNTYTIEKENVITDLNGTYYYCVVTQKYGSSTVTKTSETAKLEVLGTTIEASETNVTVYINGSSKTVMLGGENVGTFIIKTPSESTIAKTQINPDNNNELEIIPVAVGKTSVVIEEINGNKELTINIEVKETSITASQESVIAYVGGASKTVTLEGENAGEFVIETRPRW